MNLSRKRLVATLILTSPGIVFAAFHLAGTAVGVDKTTDANEISDL